MAGALPAPACGTLANSMHRVDAVTHQQAGAHGTKFNVGDKVRLSPGFKDEGTYEYGTARTSARPASVL